MLSPIQSSQFKVCPSEVPQCKGLVTACAMLLNLAVTMEFSLAQYGFTPVPQTPGYGSEWGNQYSTSLIQVPQWNPSSVSTSALIPSPQSWQLGAYLVNTPNGVVLQQIIPGSIADRTGLKAGDTIVSVGGAQVGYVNGRSTDLVYEINRRVDSSGRVQLIVLDAASRQLKNYTLTITPTSTASSGITGQVIVDGNPISTSYRTLKVEIQNATRPYMQVAGGSDYRSVYGNGPFSYTIRYDPQYIYSADRYRLVATLYDASNQVAGFGTQDIAAPTPGASAVYNLRLQGPQLYTNSTLRPVTHYYGNSSALNDAFRQFLGRDPTLSEAQAWSQQMASGAISVTEMKAELLASPAFYDRAGNNPDVFIQQMIETVTRQPASIDQIRAWRSRLDLYLGNRTAVTREFLAVYPG